MRFPPLASSMPCLALLFNGLVWGLTWWPMRYFESFGLHPLWATSWVFLCGTIILGLTQRHLLKTVLQTRCLWIIMLAAGATSASFNWAVTLGDVVRVVLLFYLMPLWTMFLARWLLKEPLGWSVVGRMILSIAGAAIVLWPDEASPLTGLQNQWFADLLSVAGGFFFALNNVLLRAQGSLAGSRCTMAMFMGGAIVAGLCALSLSSIEQIAWPAVTTPVLLGVVGLSLVFLLSNAFLQYGAARLPANITALIMMSEVFFTAIFATWLNAANLRPQVLLGGFFILLAGFWALSVSTNAHAHTDAGK